MTYTDIEKQQARQRLRYICKAIADYPENVDPILAGTDLLELLRLADFAGREVRITIPRRSENSPN